MDILLTSHSDLCKSTLWSLVETLYFTYFFLLLQVIQTGLWKVRVAALQILQVSETAIEYSCPNFTVCSLCTNITNTNRTTISPVQNSMQRSGNQAMEIVIRVSPSEWTNCRWNVLLPLCIWTAPNAREGALKIKPYLVFSRGIEYLAQTSYTAYLPSYTPHKLLLSAR